MTLGLLRDLRGDVEVVIPFPCALVRIDYGGAHIDILIAIEGVVSGLLVVIRAEGGGGLSYKIDSVEWD